jgi:hypothetical protein
MLSDLTKLRVNWIFVPHKLSITSFIASHPNAPPVQTVSGENNSGQYIQQMMEEKTPRTPIPRCGHWIKGGIIGASKIGKSPASR